MEEWKDAWMTGKTDRQNLVKRRCLKVLESGKEGITTISHYLIGQRFLDASYVSL